VDPNTHTHTHTHTQTHTHTHTHTHTEKPGHHFDILQSLCNAHAADVTVLSDVDSCLAIDPFFGCRVPQPLDHMSVIQDFAERQWAEHLALLEKDPQFDTPLERRAVVAGHRGCNPSAPPTHTHTHTHTHTLSSV
jgi:hypothetical protein